MVSTGDIGDQFLSRIECARDVAQQHRVKYWSYDSVTIFGSPTGNHSVPEWPRSFNALIRYYEFDDKVLHKEFP